MRKFSAQFTEVELQQRTRLVTVEIYVPDSLSNSDAMEFAKELVAEGQATAKPVAGVKGQCTEWEDKATGLEY